MCHPSKSSSHGWTPDFGCELSGAPDAVCANDDSPISQLEVGRQSVCGDDGTGPSFNRKPPNACDRSSGDGGVPETGTEYWCKPDSESGASAES